MLSPGVLRNSGAQFDRGIDDPGWIRNIDSGYDPALITETKTFHIQRISILLGLNNSCHSRR